MPWTDFPILPQDLETSTKKSRSDFPLGYFWSKKVQVSQGAGIRISRALTASVLRQSITSRPEGQQVLFKEILKDRGAWKLGGGGLPQVYLELIMIGKILTFLVTQSEAPITDLL
jgi:hypothetical protein